MTSRRMCGIAWATVAVYVLVAVCLTHMPKLPTGVAEVGDKRLHVMGYFMYAALIYIAAGLTWPRFRWLVMLVVSGLAVWAAVDEITQPMFGRHADVIDWVADMAGVLSAVTCLSVLRWVTKRLERSRAAPADAPGPRLRGPPTPD